MIEPTFDQFMQKLAEELKRRPPGTTADLTATALAFWDGQNVVGVFVRDDGSGLLDEEFDLQDILWDDWIEELRAWFQQPRFSERAEILNWIETQQLKSSPA